MLKVFFFGLLLSLTIFRLVFGRHVPSGVKPHILNTKDTKDPADISGLKNAIHHFGDLMRFIENQRETPSLEVKKIAFKNRKKRSPVPYSYGFCSLSKLCPIGSNYSRARKQAYQKKNPTKKSGR